MLYIYISILFLYILFLIFKLEYFINLILLGGLFFFFLYNENLISIILFITFLIFSLIDKQIHTLILYSIFIMSSLWILYSSQIISLWLSLECQSFAIILLLLYNNKNCIENIESVLKYYFITAIASILLLLGILNLSFSVNILTISPIILWNSTININYLLIIPIIFKLGLAPIHIWIPEVYQGLTFIGLIILSLIPKLVLFIVLTKLPIISFIFLLVGVLSIIIGSIGGINQINFKKLMGYSSIGHLGLIIIILSLNHSLSISYCFFYFIIYLLSTLGIFFLIINNKNKSNLIQWSNFINYKNFESIIFITFILSWLGYPPLSGFLAKWIIILNFLKNNNNLLILIFILFSLMISSFYYLRLIKLSLTEVKNFYISWESLLFKNKNSLLNYYFIIFNWGFTFFLILNPNPIFLFSQLI